MSESRYRPLGKLPSPQQPGTRNQLHALKAAPKLKILKFIRPKKFSSVFTVKARPNLWSAHRTFQARQLSPQEKPKELLRKGKPVGMKESTAAAIKGLSHTAQIWAWELTGNVAKIKAWLETLNRNDIFLVTFALRQRDQYKQLRDIVFVFLIISLHHPLFLR